MVDPDHVGVDVLHRHIAQSCADRRVGTVPLLLIRLVQGFSASGEYAGASAFLAEYAPAGRRGLYTSIVPASTAAGLLFGAAFVAALHALLSTEALHSWGGACHFCWLHRSAWWGAISA